MFTCDIVGFSLLETLPSVRSGAERTHLIFRWPLRNETSRNNLHA
jgi:hypothetical protein